MPGGDVIQRLLALLHQSNIPLSRYIVQPLVKKDFDKM
jgi:hypothetical protein